MFLELRKIIPLDGPSAKSSRFANLSKQERSQLVEQRHSGKTKGKNKQTNKLVCINLSNFRRSVSLQIFFRRGKPFRCFREANLNM